MKLKQSIHATFGALAERIADHVALVDDRQTVTYGELARLSDHIARYLAEHGVRRGDRVGLYAQRSIEAVASMLGILKAGAAYVPFDPSYPPNLLKFVYEDCAPALMLVQNSLVTAQAPAFWTTAAHDIGSVANLGVGNAPATDAPSAQPPGAQPADATTSLPDIGPDDAAYIMYTSGSTGHPKGVLIPHRGVVRLVIDNPFATMGPDQVHLQLAPLAFDACTFEIWGALLNGGKLAILGAAYPSLDDIAASIARHRVTTLWLTAGLFHLMVDHRLSGLTPLTQLLAGGDVLSPPHIAKAQQGLPGCQLINGYGPTENTTFTCCYRIPRDGATGPVPIGTPIAHTEVYVLDESMLAVADGLEGELYAGGAGVALGYWNRPELTAERFVPNPFDPTGSGKLYRTGDRVRRRADGNIEFLGRVDRQVKINGKRVELDEIEACLRRSPFIEDAAVTSPIPASGPRKVHAYCKFKNASASSIGELRAFVKRELPEYMLPATYTEMQALPLSPTGKVDRSKLPLPHAEPPDAAAMGVTTPGLAAPGVTAAGVGSSGNVQPGPDWPGAGADDEIEATLSKIWRQVLGTNSVGVDDNFFDLGGTSLQLMAVHATIASMMKSDITVVELFQFPRISALAARLGRSGASQPASASLDGPKTADGAALNAAERARRQQAALGRARANPRRNAR